MSPLPTFDKPLVNSFYICNALSPPSLSNPYLRGIFESTSNEFDYNLLIINFKHILYQFCQTFCETMYSMEAFGDCHHDNCHYNWSHLPLKKRPIKEVIQEIFIQDNYIPENLIRHNFKTYGCGECGKQFFNGVRYRAHLRRHESKRSGRYKCYVCYKTFVQRSSLTTHMRIHSGEKPFFCTECFDRFGDFSTFTKHKRIHSGEKPYSCPVCRRSFSQSGNMHRHLKAVHQPHSP